MKVLTVNYGIGYIRTSCCLLPFPKHTTLIWTSSVTNPLTTPSNIAVDHHIKSSVTGTVVVLHIVDDSANFLLIFNYRHFSLLSTERPTPFELAAPFDQSTCKSPSPPWSCRHFRFYFSSFFCIRLSCNETKNWEKLLLQLDLVLQWDDRRRGCAECLPTLLIDINAGRCGGRTSTDVNNNTQIPIGASDDWTLLWWSLLELTFDYVDAFTI